MYQSATPSPVWEGGPEGVGGELRMLSASGPPPPLIHPHKGGGDD